MLLIMVMDNIAGKKSQLFFRVYSSMGGSPNPNPHQYNPDPDLATLTPNPNPQPYPEL